jgi:cephalosporin-C deacetylase
MLVDTALGSLTGYRPPRTEPGDFDEFWKATLADADAQGSAPEFLPYNSGLHTVDVSDVTFSGYAGQPVRGWFIVPRGADRPLPCVVEYLGYNSGRGLPHDYLTWSAAGYAHLVMDNRGQGSNGVTVAVTPDPDPVGAPSAPGYLTRGIADPQTYYYRRVYTDAVRAVAAARSHPLVDAGRVGVLGTSQGGGIAIAVAGLVDGLVAALPDVPFLCHFRRAAEITDVVPYVELVQYCKTHRDEADRVFDTLDYFDGVNFAARANAPALFSVALMDVTCPPSTVYAAYNHWAGPKDISVWRFNGHEGGRSFQRAKEFDFLRELMF